MPELPEVEVVKRSIEKIIHNLTIKNIIIYNRNLRYKIEAKKLKNLVNTKVLFVKRRSKYILINLDNKQTILLHLGMSGKIIIINYKQQKFRSSFYYDLSNNLEKHNHVVFEFQNNFKLIYNDTRRFGFLKVIKTNTIYKNSHLKTLGPEPLSSDFNFKYFKLNVKNKKQSIKDCLMNQKFVAGLGNIYVNEVLFQSKINPLKKSKNLTDRQIHNILKNTKLILKKAVDKGGSSIKNFNDTEGNSGKFQDFFKVYGKDNKACSKVKCNGVVKKIRISNRSTFYCSICQK